MTDFLFNLPWQVYAGICGAALWYWLRITHAHDVTRTEQDIPEDLDVKHGTLPRDKDYPAWLYGPDVPDL